MGVSRAERLKRRAAYELATEPAVNPYRTGLTDPYEGNSLRVTALAEQATQQQPDHPTIPPYLIRRRPPTPPMATTAGIIGIVMAAALALIGLGLYEVLQAQNEYGAPDRSFYAGSDDAIAVLAGLNLLLAAVGGLGAISMLNGKLVGRMGVTVLGWSCLFLSAFWMREQTLTATAVPWISIVASIVMLSLAYHPKVTRWLGHLTTPQPE